MISVVICSRTPKISEELEKNIAETIGCDYELVVIDNSRNEYSIFSAYNKGVKRAKGNVLCFMHDDILYRTSNWGGQVEKVFENENIGLCGVIGTHVQMKGVSGHWNSCVTSGYVMTKNPVTNKYSEKKYDDVLSSDDVEVVSVDGLWMCIPHRVFKYIRWDERTFKGFHCYDADICMQVQHHNKKVVVLKNIAIEHHAVANFNTDFYESEKLWAEKWNDYLPMVRGIDVIGMHRLYMKERVAHRSVLDSKAFKLGTFLLNPFYKLKKLIK